MRTLAFSQLCRARVYRLAGKAAALLLLGFGATDNFGTEKQALMGRRGLKASNIMKKIRIDTVEIRHGLTRIDTDFFRHGLTLISYESRASR
jgi:hypothetical protein